MNSSRLKQVVVPIGAFGLAAVGGTFLYDLIGRANMKKLIKETVFWDNEWDRYTTVPPQRVEEIKDWFIPPKIDIVNERKKFDIANNVNYREIVLVRDGQNLNDAKLTGKRLAAECSNVRIIFHSPANKEIATVVSQQFNPTVPTHECDLLNEGIPATPDPPCGVEYNSKDAHRIESGFRTFFARPMGTQHNENIHTDIIIGHGNSIRFFICRAMQIDPQFWLRLKIHNFGISRVGIDMDGFVSVSQIGDIGHLYTSTQTNEASL